jgi:plastocyanin
MADWLINIVTGASGDAEFVVAFPGATQGQPLEADQDDEVTWSNETDDEHQPWQTDQNYNPVAASDLSDPIPAGQPSDNYACVQPSGNPPQWTVYYYCKLHPNNAKERGSIQVAALPQNTINIVQSGTGTTFAPQSLNSSSGTPINWFNSTNDAHQPWQTDQNYNPKSQSSLADVIQPGQPSLVYTLPTPSTAPETIYYCCKLHPTAVTERGTIVLSS